MARPYEGYPSWNSWNVSIEEVKELVADVMAGHEET